ncbi:MAG: hypothetical protein ACOYN4_17210, partial [Bacteroidales bacterium]
KRHGISKPCHLTEIVFPQSNFWKCKDRKKDDVGGGMLDVGCWMCDFGCRIVDFGLPPKP